MPPGIAAVGAAIVAAVTSTSFLVGVALSIGLSLITTFAFKPKPPKNFGGDFKNDQAGRTQQFRQPIAPQQIVYGRTRVSGPMVFTGSTSNNKYLHLVIPVAAHEIDGFECFFFDDYVVYPDDLDANGVITGSGRYSNKIRIKTHLGTDDQNADADLVSEVVEWSSAHRGRGIAYIYVRFTFSRNAFSTGVPKVSAVVRGKKLEDPRDATTRWTQNSALAVNDYLRRETKLGGVGAAASEIDNSTLIQAANVCDEFPIVREVAHETTQTESVDATNDTIEFPADETLKFQIGDCVRLDSTDTLPGGLSSLTDYYVIVKHFKKRTDGQFNANVQIQLATSYENAEAQTAVDITSTGTGVLTVTKTAEPRYSSCGMLKTDTTAIGQHLEDLRSAMGGMVIYSAGKFQFKAGAWEEPSATFDESHVRGRISTPTRRSRRERFNAVRGNYSSPLNNWQPQAYPQITNAIFEDEDNGERVYGTLEMPFTPRSNTAQRLANIHLSKNRNQIGVDLLLNLAGLQVRPGNVVSLDNTVRGWSGKTFEVLTFKLSAEGQDAPALVTDLGLISSDESDYAYDPTLSEQLVDPTPDTTLPNPYDVAAPTGLTTISEKIDTQGGDGTYKIIVSWEPSIDFFILEDGRYDVQFKFSSSDTWRPSFTVPGDQSSADLYQVQLGEEYDVRIKAVNHFGIESAFSTLVNFSVTNPGGATDTADYELITDSVSTSLNYQLITDSVTTEAEYGNVI